MKTSGFEKTGKARNVLTQAQQTGKPNDQILRARLSIGFGFVQRSY